MDKLKWCEWLCDTDEQLLLDGVFAGWIINKQTAAGFAYHLIGAPEVMYCQCETVEEAKRFVETQYLLVK